MLLIIIKNSNGYITLSQILYHIVIVSI